MPFDPAAATGCIINVQRYCTQDGPGVRTTVFLKGCPLRCLWCANPESQQIHPEFGFDPALCRSCGACTSVCPAGAITPDRLGRIDPRLCTGCGACVDTCSAHAIKRYGEYRAVEDIFSEVLRDAAFYKRTGGGVTLSGGEPALQADFTRALLQLCREQGIHTLVETAGAVPYDRLFHAVEFADEIYFDLKLASPERHKRFTGSDNAQILDNLRRLSECKPALVVRIPLIPTANDGEEELSRMAEIIAALPHVSRIGLLPYHAYGAKKYDYLGRRYALLDLLPPTQAAVEAAAALLAEKTGREVLLKI